MKYIDLFSGIGGFHIAMENQGQECVLACEKDKFARETYIINFANKYPDLRNTMFPEDITKLDINNIPDFDILCAGFPCQAFSLAGKKKGFEDTRGTLFFNIAEIILHKKPEAFILENVRNLIKHNNGQTFEIIKNTINELGYKLYYKVLNTADYGLPQARKRIYLIGFKNHQIEFNFPDPQKLTITMSDILHGHCNKDIGYTLRCGGRHSPLNDKHNWDGYLVDNKEYRLTIDDAKKMQGFPNNFVFPVSERQAMKQLGNSVSIPVVENIIKEILKNF